MKKVIWMAAVAALTVGCKKVPDGGNHGIIKMEEGATRYSDDVQGKGGAEGHGAATSTETKSAVKVDLNGTPLNAYANGLEEQMVGFLKSGGYTNADDDAALKDKWYNFDQVNFKMGSSSELEAGSQEQLDNLTKILKAYPDVKVKIGGYTDKTGNEPDNVKLSQARAEFIKSQLAKAGVGAQVVSAEGYGSQYATVPAEKSDAERAVDRKMAVRFTK